MIVVALFALVLIPFQSARQSYAVEQEIRETISPARGEITNLQLAMAIGGAALGDYLSTGSAEHLTRYQDAKDDQAQALERLAPLAEQLGDDSRRGFNDITISLAEWHAAVDQLLQQRAPLAPLAEIPSSGDYDDAVLAAARLDFIIGRIGEERRAAARETEERGLALSAALLVVALVAAAGVAWIGWRLHYYAVVAERGRVEVERVMESRARLMRGFSHDVKNPLGAANGQLQLLEMGISGPLLPDHQRGIAAARRSIGSALELIDDLVELARAEAGQLEFHLERTDPLDIVGRVAAEYTATAEAEGLTLEIDADGKLPTLQTDSDRVRQILGNLMSNAVKYTPAGGRITIRAAAVDHARVPGTGPGVAFAVTDTGPGVPPEERDLIFEEFTRFRPGTIRGAGLGLAISRRIARDLGGDITLDSEVGKGSTFTLLLPREPA